MTSLDVPDTPRSVEHDRDIDRLAAEIHQTAEDKGFWDSPRNLGEMLMLATSELAEALEADRDGQKVVWFLHDRHCPWGGSHPHRKPEGCRCDAKPEGAAVEVMDCVIRCLDTVQDMLSDTQFTPYDVMRLKMTYNHTRAYKHGKGY